MPLGLALNLLLPALVETPCRAEETEEIVVLGVRGGRLERVVAAHRDVLRTDDFAGEHQSLADLLEQRPGVFVRRFGGAGDPSELSIRGASGSQVLVTLNGVRANSALTGGVDLTRLCVPLVAEIGISRGAGAAREGSGAIGGVVDLVTRAAGPRPETRVTFAGGAFDTLEGSVFRSARVGELAMSVGYCGLDTEGDFEFARPSFRGPDGVPAQFTPPQTRRINNRSTQHAGSLGVGGTLGGGRLELFDYWTRSEGGAPGIDCCNGVAAGQNPRAEREDWSNLAQLRWVGAPGSLLGGGLEAMLYHRHEESRFRDPVQLLGGRVDSLTRLSSVGWRSAARWELPGVRASLSLDAVQDVLRGTRQRGRARTALAGTLTLALHAADGRVRVEPALRLDWADGFDPRWIPALGVVVTPWDWLRLRANGGRAFRYPNLDELFHPDEGFLRGNPRLSPEDVWQFDVGAELLLEQLGPLSQLRLSAAYFRRAIDELILWVRINDTTVAPINTSAATSEGLELALDFAWSPFVHLSASHTELDSSRDATGLRLPGQPDRESELRLRIGPESLFKLVGALRRTGDILVSEGGGRRLPARSLWSARAALNLAELPGWQTPLESLWVYLAVDNIGDEAVRDTLSFPQPGRQASAGFEAKW